MTVGDFVTFVDAAKERGVAAFEVGELKVTFMPTQSALALAHQTDLDEANLDNVLAADDPIEGVP